MLVYPSIILGGNKQLNFVEGKKVKVVWKKRCSQLLRPICLSLLSYFTIQKGKRRRHKCSSWGKWIVSNPIFQCRWCYFFNKLLRNSSWRVTSMRSIFYKTCRNKKVKMGITTVKKCIQSCMHTWATSICQLPTLCQSLQQSSFQTLEMVLHIM